MGPSYHKEIPLLGIQSSYWSFGPSSTTSVDQNDIHGNDGLWLEPLSTFGHSVLSRSIDRKFGKGLIETFGVESKGNNGESSQEL